MTDVPCAFDRSPDTFNKHEVKIVANIREFGFQGTHVCGGEDARPFSYSTGFWRMASIPEILILTLQARVSQSLFGHLFDRARDGFVPPVGVAVPDVMVGYDCYFFPISPTAYEDYPLSSNWFYGNRDYPCLQLVWADEMGLFPWQAGFNERFRDDQPDLSPDGWRAHLAN